MKVRDNFKNKILNNIPAYNTEKLENGNTILSAETPCILSVVSKA